MNELLVLPSLSYDRLAFHRKLLVFMHLVLGCGATLIYLNQVDFASFAYWRPRSALGVLFIAAPPIIPYAVSGIHAWHVVTARRLGMYLFLIVLLAGAIVNALIFLGAFDISVDGSTVLWVVIVQTLVYFWGGELLLTMEAG